MKNNTSIRAQNAGILSADDVLKETAFIYLKEALVAQQFEECAGLIAQAKSFGATQEDISAILTEYRREYAVQFDIEAHKLNKDSRF